MRTLEAFLKYTDFFLSIQIKLLKKIVTNKIKYIIFRLQSVYEYKFEWRRDKLNNIIFHLIKCDEKLLLMIYNWDVTSISYDINKPVTIWCLPLGVG